MYLENLIPLLNIPIIGLLFRRLLWIEDYRHKIVKLLPYSFHVDLGNGSRRAVIYVNNQFDEAARKNLGWLLWPIHWLDTVIINRLNPAWNLGFDTLNLQPDGATGLDTDMHQNSPTTNFGTSAELRVGEFLGAANAEGRTLIELNITSIDSGSNISAAEISLFLYNNVSGGAETWSIYRVIRDWVETEATWNKFSTAGGNWGTAGCSNTTTDRDALDFGTLVFGGVPATGQFHNIEMDGQSSDYAELEAQVGNTPSFANKGWLIQDGGTLNRGNSCRSSDWTTPAERPKVAITYTPPSTGVISKPIFW